MFIYSERHVECESVCVREREGRESERGRKRESERERKRVEEREPSIWADVPVNFLHFIMTHPG